MLNAKEKALLGQMLDEYSERLSNDGCNDWEWPEDWTPEERAAFCRESYLDDEWDESDIPNPPVLDNTSVVELLRKKLLEDRP